MLTPPTAAEPPHKRLARAMIAAGWTGVRLADECTKHAHATGELARRIDEPRVSRIVNGHARPTPAQAVAFFAVLVGAPTPGAWGFVVDDPPEPARPTPPKPRRTPAKAAPGAVRRGRSR